MSRAQLNKLITRQNELEREIEEFTHPDNNEQADIDAYNNSDAGKAVYREYREVSDKVRQLSQLVWEGKL